MNKLKVLFIFTTSFFGSYLVVRSISFWCGGFPSESLVIDLIGKEEWNEFQCALKENRKSNISAEFGDILFTLVNVARFAEIHPETALKDSIKKFETRFRNMEKTVAESGRALESVSRNELDMMWEEVKKA